TLEALKKQAKDWLAQLDPLSLEGLWFEKFAEGYPSKLEAAIEYVQNSE
ncbi:MAG: salt stress protein, Slr1339 family, partial [Brasilonema sp.]